MPGTALITGGGKRLGKEIANKLADMGFNIALHYNASSESAHETANQIRGKVECNIFQTNLGNEQELYQLIPAVKKRCPDFNLLVNNASTFEKISIKETTPEIFHHHFNINFRAPFFLTHYFANYCQAGHIINMLDSKITHHDNHYASYTLSKKALADLTLMAAKEFAPNIRVNGICPSYVYLEEKNESSLLLKKRHQTIPLQRFGTVEEITASIEFLINNTYLTGQLIFVNGGDHLSF